MARKRTELNKQHKKRLIDLLQHSFGKPVTHSFECEQLSREIEKGTGETVSPNTLRRLFGFIDTEFSPSIRTLNVLAAYAGFVNWHQFVQRTDKEIYEPMTLDHEANLYLDFYQIETKAEADMNFHNAARNIAFRILFNPALLHKLAPFLAKHPVAQIFFFERFPFIDAVSTDYKRSIQLYLQKKTDEAQVFGHSLLFLGAFLSGDQKEQKFHLEKLNQYALNDQLHPFIIARYIGSNILYAVQLQQPFQQWIQEAIKWNNYFSLRASRGIWYYPFYQHLMSDYLNLAGLFEYSHQIVRTIKQYPKPYEIERGYEEGLEAVYEVAIHKTSPERFKKWMETTKVFNTMNPLFRKYLELQALAAYYPMLRRGRKKEKTEERIRSLIAQTGFRFFLQALEAPVIN